MMIDADKFYKDAETVSSFGERWIHISYKEFLKFFASKEKITPHDFRHTCITNHCKNGTPETHIKSIMGLKKNTEVLRIYDHNKTKAYEEYLRKKGLETKPTYELLVEQKKTLEEKHQKQIDGIMKMMEILGFKEENGIIYRKNDEMDKWHKVKFINFENGERKDLNLTSEGNLKEIEND